MASIPASAIVTVTPSVISAGGSALDLNGLIVTTNPRLPVGQVIRFANQADVASYFGPISDEAAKASIYFLGFDNSNRKPGALLFSRYSTGSSVAYMRGGNVAAAMTLDQLKTLTGVLTITVDGAAKTSSTINLSGATSFSNAATIIQAAFTNPGFTVLFESLSGAFVFSGPTSITTATGTLAAPLLLTTATGAMVSPSSGPMVPAVHMDSVKAQNQNWATFTTLFDPDAAGVITNKLAFATWSNAQNNRFMYVPWDVDLAPTTSAAATASLGYIVDVVNQYSGVFPVFSTGDAAKAVAALGFVASIDFTEPNGRATLAFRTQSGLAPDVTNQTVANNLIANGYNFYGSYATANDQFNFMYPGQVSGQYLWADSFANQIWLNNALQLALMVLLVNAKSIPYNASGYAQMKAACADPIQAALTFGAIRAGVTLSQQQAASVNASAGLRISDTLQNVGYYLQVLDASPQVRAARGSPPAKLWYTDGQSVQSINLASIAIQ